MSKRQRLDHLMREHFNVDAGQWQNCLSAASESGLSLVRILTSRGLVSEENLLQLLSRHLNLPLMRIKIEDIDPEAAHTVPSKMVTHYNFMPIRFRENRLQIAVNDPMEILTLDEIRLFLNRDIDVVVARQKDITDAIKNFYGVGAETLEAISSPEQIVSSAQETKEIQNDSMDPSVVKFLNQVLLDAIKQGATDIHFEPFEDDLRIRYRIDGVLYEVACPASIKKFQSSIASRIKVMANLDIAEKRRPQDGRIDVRLEGKAYDLRVSVMPTPFGESIGIRILERSSPIIGLERLGLPHDGLSAIEKMIARPHGIILVTGPTGSGKTTTLYACLNKINSSERKILTIEDPIEYQLKGITQMQIEPKIGFTFANALRSMLRHDPDVMMVGEIRDTETAELAVRTSLTGHLVLSTLHTNDAAGGITRLLDMGIDAFLVSSSLNLIIAQRLIRLICPGCKEKHTPGEEIIRAFSREVSSGDTLYRGGGCETCRHTGYKGRTGIFEMIVITDAVRDMILKKLPPHLIRGKMIGEGMKTLRDAGWDKIIEGATTPEEVLRVTQEEI